MSSSMDSFQCTRCERLFSLEENHTEIVRRDFVRVPQPSRIEYLCSDCLRDYENFLIEPVIER